MATLAGNTIASTYPLLLKVDSNGLDGTLRAIQDGDATDSVLYLATDSALISGNGTKLYFFDADGGEHISANNGGVLSIAGGSEIDLTATAIDINGTVDMSSTLTIGGDLTIPQKIVHAGNTNNYLSFGTDSLSIYQAGAEKFQFQYSNIYIKTNNQALVGYTSGGAAKELIKIDGSDVVQIGEGLVTTFTNDIQITETHPGILFTDSDDNSDSRIYHSAGSLYIDADNNNEVGSSIIRFSVDDAQKFVLNANSIISLSNNDNGSSNTLFGDSCGDNIDSGSNFNVFIGKSVATGSTDDASDNVAIGYESMKAIIQGDDNVALGMRTLLDLEDGSHNTAIGDSVLRACVDASDNTAVGSAAMDATTTGNNNVAVGKNALGNTADADKCVAIGSAALSQSNITSAADGAVGVGYFALGNLTTGASNTALGFMAGYTATTGGENVLLGYEAGKLIDGGEGNIAIGYKALDVAVGTNRNIAIGYSAMGSVSTSDGNDNIAIGHDALGGSGSTSGDHNICLGYNSGNGITGGGTNVCIGYQAGKDTVVLTSGDNNVLIGTNVRTANATNSNNICIGHDIDAGNNEFAFGKASNKVINNFDADADWDRSSDVRKKRNINDAKLGLDFVNDLRPVTFQWRPNYDFPKDFVEYSEENNMNLDVVMHGMIAQEVKEALDKTDVERFGGWKEDKHGSQYLSKEAFVIPLIKAVQELTAKVEELESKLNNKES